MQVIDIHYEENGYVLCMFEGLMCHTLSPLVLFNRLVFILQDAMSVTKRSQNSLEGWQCSEGQGIKMDCLLNQGSIPSPGSLCLKAVFSKAVSGVRDCASNTGD